MGRSVRSGAIVLAILGLLLVALVALQSAPAASSTPEPTVGGSAASAAGASSTGSPSGSGAASPSAAACLPTDQDLYVYNPDRLRVLGPCIRVTGRIVAVRTEADGDLHLLLDLDPAFASLLTAANQGQELGALVIEPVCVRTVTQADAEDTCARDPDPMTPPFPRVGDRVWMEGRYVLDLQHGGWAELHPLYRWGAIVAEASSTP